MELTLKREFSYYMLTIYVPTCMLVIVSWFSFWIDPKVSWCFLRFCLMQKYIWLEWYFQAVPARVALGVTTLLTMSTKTASISNSLPPVAYTKVFHKKVQIKAMEQGEFWISFGVQINLLILRCIRGGKNRNVKIMLPQWGPLSLNWIEDNIAEKLKSFRSKADIDVIPGGWLVDRRLYLLCLLCTPRVHCGQRCGQNGRESERKSSQDCLFKIVTRFQLRDWLQPRVDNQTGKRKMRRGTLTVNLLCCQKGQE